MKSNHRKNIYYWKSDRPYVDGNVQDLDTAHMADLVDQLSNYLSTTFRHDLIQLKPAGGQGNHITFLAAYPNSTYFVRVENGPERDDYMDVESAVLRKVHEIGIPSPKVFHSDNTRAKVPFAVQVIEYINSKDLNELEKEGRLDMLAITESIGKYVAQWQQIAFPGFGLFDPAALLERGVLEGYHTAYRDYFFLNWEMHLDYLCKKLFLDEKQLAEIKELVGHYQHLLDIPQGCLVHKDLALWNILGETNAIHAFIDWSDTISGDVMDDISLLGCFHTGRELMSMLKGYASVKALPEQYENRFWLHLLRNIIFKAVIRVKGNYFNKPDSFFMNNAKSSTDLKTFTLERISIACEGLKGKKKIEDL